MKQLTRTRVLFGLLALAVIAGCVSVLMNGRDPRPAPNMAGTYYTGPKKNKSGQEVFVDENGKQYNITPVKSGITPPNRREDPPKRALDSE